MRETARGIRTRRPGPRGVEAVRRYQLTACGHTSDGCAGHSFGETENHRIFSALLGLIILTVAITRASPAKLCIGQDGLYSNSQFQLVAWFTALIVSYIAAVWFRSWDIHEGFLAGINIPINILLLSGASALTFGSAKGITANKVEEAVRTTGVKSQIAEGSNRAIVLRSHSQ